MSLNPWIIFLAVIVIGAVAGWVAEQYFPGAWLPKKVVGVRRVLFTSILVGIAGSFIGLHLAALLGFRELIVPLLGAVLGSAVIVWAWRTVNL
jgi:uncharacterized membrane protein YeaQ/YmgE (transglycosylase-associated protein family)